MSVRSVIKKLLYGSSNRQHYLKFRLDKSNDWSIRYFFRFDTRYHMTGKWFLKSHFSKDYIELSKNEAIAYIETYNCRSCEEIHGVITADDGYQKSIVIHPL